MTPAPSPHLVQAPASSLQLRRVDLRADRDAVFQLSVEYMSWVMQEMAAQLPAIEAPMTGSVEAYVARTLDQVCGHAPPEGAFYLVEHGAALAGMCGLRRIAPGVAEFKRIYVRPSHRGLGLGEALLQRLIGDATAFKCQKAVLDTAPFMHAAQRLYAAAGFERCPPYEGTEVPRPWHGAWHFMQRRL